MTVLNTSDSGAAPGSDGSPDVLHGESLPTASWSSGNLAEAVPGVMTPLCASAWVPASELGLRAPFHAMGALSGKQLAIPADPLDRITNAFYGRMAVRVDFLCEIGDLIPGQTGEALSRDFFGFVPPDFVSKPSNRRLPVIAFRYPRTLSGIARDIDRRRRDTDEWWRAEIVGVPALELEPAQLLLGRAMDRFSGNLAAQAVVAACAIQPVYEQLTTLAATVDVDATDLMRGHGSHEESVVLSDLWSVSRDQLELPEFLARHGYHGAGEGEVSTTVWREDSSSIARIIDRYRALDDSDAPGLAESDWIRQREAAERKMFAGLGMGGRVRARVLLRLARRFIPLRGVGKVSYLQALDIVRATARRIGELLVQDGRLETSDDAFYLTREEITGPLRGTDLAATVAERRAARRRYESLEVPTTWTGNPTATPISEPEAEPATELHGTGVSPGVVEGRAVVVLDPADAEVNNGAILVAHTTDPSWVSLMFLSAALVVDIGGPLSHAAVVARELGVPCVMNTGNGTRVIRSGDTVRVDGATGSVEIVTRSKEIHDA